MRQLRVVGQKCELDLVVGWRRNSDERNKEAPLLGPQ